VLKVKTYKQMIANLLEANNLSSGESKVKEFTIGKSKEKALITKKGSKYIVYIEGAKLDEFDSKKEAESSALEFAKLMGK
jgi:hypothetical protein